MYVFYKAKGLSFPQIVICQSILPPRTMIQAYGITFYSFDLGETVSVKNIFVPAYFAYEEKGEIRLV